jgi:hypothetical protein
VRVLRGDFFCVTDPVRVDTQRTRLVRKARPTDSFFNFFNPPVPPTEEAIENGDIEDEELEDIEEKLEEDYQIGEDLKEKARFSCLLVSRTCC